MVTNKLKELHKGHWHVMIYEICGETFFRCYKLRDPEGSYGSSNRKMDNIAYDNRYEAEARCRELNGQGLGMEPTRMDQHPMNW